MKQITFNDVLIEPQYSEILSRRDVSIKTTLSNSLHFDIPICGANMKDISGFKMVEELTLNGAFGILHRFWSIEENIQQFKKCSKPEKIGVSIGTKEEEKERFIELHKVGAKIYTIDIAHGNSLNMKNMIKYVKEYDQNIIVIAGNIATGSAAINLYNWGADIIKIGIGPSPVCETRRNVGVGVSQLHALKCIDEELKKNKIQIFRIADGGIKYVGDICKALKYSDMCMLGSMLSGYVETPGKFFQRIDENGELEWYSLYGGSASSENTGSNHFSEGRIKTVRMKGKVKYQLRKIEDGIRSAFSYSNSKNLTEYQEKCILNEISIASMQESKF